ncbi:MAG: hypothetical protein PHD51_02665 [Patescibacteria group bacterium]|nr:hypothetical protein [Patescibacteria group bacterium]MDD5490239.1 hypothetical protein [Patescibacteria group bacterium]
MSFEIKRKRGETFEAMLRRFNRRMIQSKKLIQVKEGLHFKRTTNKNLRKRSALHRLKVRAEKEYLRKIGKLKEEDYKNKFFRK